MREKELQTAQTVWVWTDLTPSMAFKSPESETAKVERALLLMFAVTHLLVSAGEKVGVPNMMAPTMRRGALRLMAENILSASSEIKAESFPETDDIRANSSVVVISDFLDEPEKLETSLAALASKYVDLHLIMVSDPAEEDFPFSGRTRFMPVEDGSPYIAGRAETIRGQYQDVLSAHRDAVLHAANIHGATLLRHRTDHSPDVAVLALAAALSGNPYMAEAS